MLLTLNARRTASGSIRRLPPRRLIAVAAAIGAGAGASLALRPMLSPATAPAEQPVWAGAIGDGVAGPIVIPERETSASYTSPVAIQAAARTRAKPCAETGCAAPQRDVRTLLPPRRPAAEPAVVAPAPAPTVVADAPPPPKPKSVFTPAGLIERLPKADTLLKPFTTVSDKMSGLIKRF